MSASPTINTHNLVIEFGKHRGERWTRLPVSYLRWLANEAPEWSATANAELERRGTLLSRDVELSSHAVDRASLRCRKIWHETSQPDEGLYSWLVRMATEALAKCGEQEKVRYNGLKLVFAFGAYYPVLKSVMPA